MYMNVTSSTLFPPQGVLDRFSQVKPKVIFSVEAVRYNNKTHDHMQKLRDVVAGEGGREGGWDGKREGGWEDGWREGGRIYSLSPSPPWQAFLTWRKL